MITLYDNQISIEISTPKAALKTRDGSWIVQVPPEGVSLLSANCPGMVNVQGTNQVNIHASDIPSNTRFYAGDTVILALPGSGRGSYWDVPGRSAVTQMMAVVFVSYPLTPGLFRPPAIGNNIIARFFRTAPIPESKVNLNNLPSVIDVNNLPVDWTGWGKSKPTIPYLTNLLSKFGGDCYDGWSTDTRTPDTQHPGYGTYYASIVSQALVQLCSTAPHEEKLPLALAVAQRGLDLAGAFADGRKNYPSGGHMQGRKALIITAGVLMDIPPFQEPNLYLGKVFQEDLCYEYQPWFAGGWTAGWKFKHDLPAGSGTLLASNPTSWGDPNSPTHSTFAWMVGGYMPQVVGSQIGTVLAMRLMKKTKEMGVYMDKMIEQWMNPVPEIVQPIQQAGINLPWGTDYAVSKGSTFCEKAWKQYA
jgi:hypothetical protein